MIEEMKKQYIVFKNKIGKKIREKERKANGKTILSNEEANEEEYEVLDSNKVLLKDDNQDSNYFTSLNLAKPIQDLDLIINSLHADILINLYRC